MMKKFTDGLVFGAGFAISFIALWYIAAYYVTPIIAKSQLERLSYEYPSGVTVKPQSSQSFIKPDKDKPRIPFHELDIDEQIKLSSVIALAKYEPASDGRMKAFIKEFLKKDPDTTIYYDVGDEYPSSSYIPKGNTSYGDGVVIFFTGSPATMRMSMSYSGDRIRGLGDLPLKLFREKCR